MAIEVLLRQHTRRALANRDAAWLDIAILAALALVDPAQLAENGGFEINVHLPWGQLDLGLELDWDEHLSLYVTYYKN